MSRILEPRYAEDIAEEITRFLGDEYHPYEIIPGLIKAIELYLRDVPQSDLVLDEVMDDLARVGA